MLSLIFLNLGMKKALATLLFLLSVSLYSQDEKRLALVIGNANYEKGELKNPVNDARLIASTLDSLNFEVLLYENLQTRRDMLSAVNEFGAKLPEYEASFVYYAGHGIQMNNENFLLPTKEVFEMEIDVEDYGVSVQRILKYIETVDVKKINVLVIDACRDNPFESNWNATRSLKGSGLAKVNPPTGSLIAFSTDSGNTAPDGERGNSIYTKSLSKNLLKPDTSIEQIFKYVRQEVLEQSQGIQKPVENNTLIGDPYIFNKSNYFKSIYELGKIINEGERPWFNSDEENKVSKIIEKIEEYTSENSTVIAAKLMLNLRDFDSLMKIYSEINFDNHNVLYSNFYKYSKAISIYSMNRNERCPYENEEMCIILLNEAVEILDKLEKTDLKNIYWFENKTEFMKIRRFYVINDIIQTSLVENYNQDINKVIQRLENSIIFYEEFYKDNISFFKDDPEIDLYAERYMKVSRKSDLLKLKESAGYDKNILVQEWRNLFKEFPDDINLLSSRINKIMSLYEYELARTLINRLIALDPIDPGSYFLLYLIDRSNKDYLSAILNLKYSIERNDGNYYIPGESLHLNSDYLLTIGQSTQVDYPPINNFQLGIFLSELYGLIGNKNQMCIEYETLLSMTEDQKSIKLIKDLILENCNSID